MQEITGAGGAASAQAGSGSGMMGGGDPGEQKEMFLDLLVAQMKNQSPKNPMDSKQMLSQFSQFSSVEAQLRTNELLEESGRGGNGKRMEAVDLVGQNVWASGEPVAADGSGQPHAFRFSTEQPGPMKARVLNDSGQVVREMDLGDLQAGSHQGQWDGQTESGGNAPQGRYRIEVVRQDSADPEPMEAATRSSVGEVRFGDDDQVELGLGNGRFVPFERVTAVTS